MKKHTKNRQWKVRMGLGLCGLFAIALLFGCDPGLQQLDSKVETLDVVLTPTTKSRRFVVQFSTFTEKDTSWNFRKLAAAIKYTFQTRDADNPRSAHVAVGLAIHPLNSPNGTNNLCFLQPGECNWKRKELDLQKDYQWNLGDQVEISEEAANPGQRKWTLYVDIELLDGAPVTGKLEIDCQVFIKEADKEELQRILLEWTVQELIKE